MKNKIICLLIIAVTLLSCTSCLQAESLEEFGYVLTVGVDKGVMQKYNVSFLLESEKSQTEEGSSSEPNIICAEGDNIYSAVYSAESGLPYRLNFSRATYMIVAYDIAADNDIIEFFSTSWATLKVRTSANMFITQSTAYDFIKGLTYGNDVNITKMEKNFVDSYENEGLTGMMSITDFMSAAKSPYYDAVVPMGSIDSSVDKKPNEAKDTTGGVIRYGGMKSYMLGSALFDGSMLRGVLSARENQILLIIQGESPSTFAQFTRGDGTSYTVLISAAEAPIVDVKIVNGNAELKYHIRLSVMLVQESSFHKINEMRKNGKLEKAMEKEIVGFMKMSCDEIFRMCRSVNSDALGTGKYVCKKFSTVKEWERFNYKERYKDTQCSFDIKIDTQDIYMSTYLE